MAQTVDYQNFREEVTDAPAVVLDEPLHLHLLTVGRTPWYTMSLPLVEVPGGLLQLLILETPEAYLNGDDGIDGEADVVVAGVVGLLERVELDGHEPVGGQAASP